MRSDTVIHDNSEIRPSIVSSPLNLVTRSYSSIKTFSHSHPPTFPRFSSPITQSPFLSSPIPPSPPPSSCLFRSLPSLPGYVSTINQSFFRAVSHFSITFLIYLTLDFPSSSSLSLDPFLALSPFHWLAVSYSVTLGHSPSFCVSVSLYPPDPISLLAPSLSLLSSSPPLPSNTHSFPFIILVWCLVSVSRPFAGFCLMSCCHEQGNMQKKDWLLDIGIRVNTSDHTDPREEWDKLRLRVFFFVWCAL